jgi:hypothetical protein
MTVTSPPIGFFPVDATTKRYYTMQGEDTNYARKYWINRKEDRFTLSSSYMRSGHTKTGKQWYKWEQAYAVSVSARKLKNGKRTVNVYLNNRLGNRIYLRNFTANPRMIQEYLTEEILAEFLKELQYLAVRAGFVTQERIDDEKSKTTFDTGLQIFSLLSHIAYPTSRTVYTEPKNFKTSWDVSYENGVPIFASPLLRLKDNTEIAKELKLGTDATQIFLKKAGSIPVETLYLFQLIAGYATDDTQVKILNDIVEKGRTSSFISQMWEIEPRTPYTPHIRQILRILPKESLQGIILSHYFYDDMSQTLQQWVGLSRRERNITITEPINELRDALLYITTETKKHKESEAVEDSVFTEFFESINDGKHVKFGHRGSYVEVMFGGVSSYLSTGFRSSGTANRGRVNNINHGEQLNLEHPIWKYIHKSQDFIRNTVDLAGYSHSRELPAFPQGNGGSFSPKLYLEFLNMILAEGDANLKKHGVPLTKQSRSLAFALVYFSMLKKQSSIYKKISPNSRKIYKLHKLGVDTELIYQSITHGIPMKKIEQYAGLPLVWSQNMLGLEPLNSDRYDF